MISRILRKASYILYYIKTGYAVDGERVNPDFPTENFQNHLKMYKFAEQFVNNKDVLDVGCGTGYGTALLAGTAKGAVGVDFSAAAIKWASKRYPQVRYLEMDAHYLEFPDNSFDFIISTENFEHLHDQARHARELARVLRPDGLCIVATPNPEMFVGVNNHFHAKENTLPELRDLFAPVFEKALILENTSLPCTPKGLSERDQRWSQGLRGDPLPTCLNTTWLHNTHSFVCILTHPRKHF